MKQILYFKKLVGQQFVKPALQKKPFLYMRLLKYKYRGKNFQKKLVNRNTDIVIEGFPRSANSFAVKAFEFSNGKSYRIATHVHAYPQVIEAIRLKIPTLLLIREPESCIRSFVAYKLQSFGRKNFESEFDISWMLKDYIRFYKNLLPYKNQVVIGTFEAVRNDFGEVLNAVNKKFDVNFELFEHSEEHLDQIFKNSKRHLFPSDEREKLKLEYQDSLNEVFSSNLFTEAVNLYNAWCT